MTSAAVISYEASRAETPEGIEEFLREQLEAIADELFARIYRPRQSLWKSEQCPWCRRLREINSDAPCPICSQIRRSRRARREEVA
jgi:rubrerythrin